MQSQEPTQQCREIFALLSDYLNLELPPDACKSIETHLAGCPPCIEFVESLKKTIEICRKFQPAELPAPLVEEAREELLEAYRKMLTARRAGS